MPRPGFYNDNEYRAYPFVPRAEYAEPGLPDSAVVDCGIIMGIDSQFEHGAHTVWLAGVSRANGLIQFTFNSDAPGTFDAPLVFECQEAAQEWLTVFGESESASDSPESCATEPRWEGFLVVGPLAPLIAWLAANGNAVSFTAHDRALEPGRIQSLMKSYVRAVNVANLPRVRHSSPAGCASAAAPGTAVVVNAACLQGHLRFKEGVNCRIRQIDRSSELVVSVEQGAGDPDTSELCDHGGELPLYANEPFDAETGFYSGGPSCKQVISTINGIGGANVNITGGTGVSVVADAETNSLTISLTQNNVVGNCGT